MTQDIIQWKKEWKPEPICHFFDLCLLALLSFGAGVAFGGWYRDVNPYPLYTYYNVKVLRKFEDYHFQMEVNGQNADIYFCKDYEPLNGPNGLVEGCLLHDITYEDRPCGWDMGLPYTSYHYIRDEQRNALDWNGKVCWRNH